MRWDKVAYLIKEGETTYDDLNNPIREESERKIYCNKRRLTYRDKTNNLESKNKISGQIEMHANEYKGERLIKLEGRKYKIDDVSDLSDSNILISYAEYNGES